MPKIAPWNYGSHKLHTPAILSNVLLLPKSATHLFASIFRDYVGFYFSFLFCNGMYIPSFIYVQDLIMRTLKIQATFNGFRATFLVSNRILRWSCVKMVTAFCMDFIQFNTHFNINIQYLGICHASIIFYLFFAFVIFWSINSCTTLGIRTRFET